MQDQISKKLSCGVILINENKEILMIHVTGQSFWDLPKGTKKEDEREVDAAIRELKEETGISILESDMLDMSWYEYNNYKDLWLFMAKMPDINLSELGCSSYFFENSVELPEADDYSLFSLEKAPENSCKSLSRLFDSTLVNDIEIFYNKLFK